MAVRTEEEKQARKIKRERILYSAKMILAAPLTAFVMFFSTCERNKQWDGSFAKEAEPDSSKKEIHIKKKKQKPVWRDLSSIAFLNDMRSLPLAGAGVAEIIETRNLKIGAVNGRLEDSARGKFIAPYKLLYDNSQSDSVRVLAYEFFHVAQHANHRQQVGRKGLYLTYHDETFSILLEEATAKAYEYVFWKESRLNGAKNDVVLDPGLQSVFDAAYARDYKAHKKISSALQAGGRAVTYALLNGRDKNWTAAYGPSAAWQAHARLKFIRDEDVYNANRANYYSESGKVSRHINLTPPVYLGPQAKPAIEKAFYRATGMR